MAEKNTLTNTCMFILMSIITGGRSIYMNTPMYTVMNMHTAGLVKGRKSMTFTGRMLNTITGHITMTIINMKVNHMNMSINDQ